MKWMVAVLATSGLVSAQGQVWVVDDDGGPGVDATDLFQALALVSDGDTILVRDGSYPQLSPPQFLRIDQLGLQVIAETPGTVNLGFPILVENQSATQTVVLRGLDVDSSSGSALIVQFAQGTVWIEDCTFESSSPYGPAVWLNNSKAAVLLRSRFLNTEDLGEAFIGAPVGLFHVGSKAYAYDCTATGGPGGTDVKLVGGGGDGTFVNSGLFFASGGSSTGGKGGPGVSGIFGCLDPGTGGDGLVLGAANPSVFTLGVRFVGGPGGDPAPCNPGPGQPGASTSVQTGTLTALPGTPRSFSLTSPITDGSSTILQADGLGGDLLFVGVSTAASPAFAPAWSGALLLDGTPMVVSLGSLPPSGSVTLSFPVSLGVGPGQALRFYAQALMVDVSGAGVLAGGSELTVLGPLP